MLSHRAPSLSLLVVAEIMCEMLMMVVVTGTQKKRNRVCVCGVFVLAAASRSQRKKMGQNKIKNTQRQQFSSLFTIDIEIFQVGRKLLSQFHSSTPTDENVRIVLF